VDQQLQTFLDDLYRSSREHDERQADRLERWRNVEPDSARLLAVLVRALAPRRLLELGTSNAYSTIWLADAARAVGGSLTTVEVDPARAWQGRENLRRAGVEKLVEIRVEDAGEVLRTSSDGEWDFVFLDAERPAYAAYWPDLLRVLGSPGLLAVDNVLSHADEVAEFRALVAAEPRVAEALAPTGAGVLLVTHDTRR